MNSPLPKIEGSPKLLQPDRAPPSYGANSGARSPLSGNIGFQNRTTPEAAKMARIAGRLNASKTSDDEYESLLNERQSLVEKQYGGAAGLTRREKTRLTFVQWSLDRIEDAKYGSGFDELESQVSELERFAEQVDRLLRDLTKATQKRKR